MNRLTLPFRRVVQSGIVYVVLVAALWGGASRAAAQACACWWPHCYQNCYYPDNCRRGRPIEQSESYTPQFGPGIGVLGGPPPGSGPGLGQGPLVFPVPEYAPVPTLINWTSGESARLAMRQSGGNLAAAAVAPQNLGGGAFGHSTTLWASGPSTGLPPEIVPYDGTELAPEPDDPNSFEPHCDPAAEGAGGGGESAGGGPSGGGGGGGSGGGCGDSGPPPTPGDERPTDVILSISLRLNLGSTQREGHAGYLWLHAEGRQSQYGPIIIDPPLNRESVSVVLDTRPGNAEGLVRQVLTPQVLADVDYTDWLDPNTGADEPFYINFYRYEDRGSQTALDPNEPNGVQVFVPPMETTPLIHWKFWQTGTTTKTFHAEKYIGDSETPDVGYEWTEAAGGDMNWDFSRIVSSSTVQTGQVRLKHGLKTITYSEGSDVMSKVKEGYGTIDGRRVLMMREIDPGGAALRTEYSYYGADPNDPEFEAVRYTRVGRIKKIVAPDGAISTFAYDDYGRMTAENYPFAGDNPSDDPGEPNAPHRYEYTYSEDETDFRPIQVQEFIGGVPVRLTSYVYSIDSSDPNHPFTVIEEKRHFDPTDDESGALVTTYTYESEQTWRVASIEHPDGRLDLYEHELGDYDPNSGAFSPNASGEFERRTVTHATTTSPTGIVNETTRTHYIVNRAGQTVSTVTEVKGSGGYEPISWQVPSYDDRGRIVQIAYSNGTAVTRAWGTSCCIPDTVTDADGIDTDYEYDELRRLETVTRAGVSPDPDLVTSYVYSYTTHNDDGVRVTQTTVSPSGSANELVTIEYHDLAGRLLYRKDPAGYATTWTYANGGRDVTMTNPDGSTQITSRYYDGQVASVTGTAVVAQTYEYGVDNGSRYTTAFTGPAGVNSPRSQTTTYDALGRVSKVASPAFDHGTPITSLYTYNETTGQLIKTQPKHGGTELLAATVYEYDEMGHRIRSGLNVNEDEGNVLDPNSADRISESHSDFEKSGGQWWRRTVQSTYRTTDSPSSSTLTTRRQRLTGLGSGTIAISDVTDIIGNKTTVTTTISGGVRTETTDIPGTDNTIVRESVEGRVREVTDRAGLTTAYAYDGFRRLTHVTDSRSNTTETCYDTTTGQMSCTKDGDGNETAYHYYDPNTAHAGRLLSVENPDAKFTYYAYSPRGETTRVWGHVPQPVAMRFDTYGQRRTLSTFRDDSAGWTSATWPGSMDPNDPADADITTWTYDAATGLMTQKRYADDYGPDYDYTVDGRLARRTWARSDGGGRIYADYTYFSAEYANTGDLKKVDYSDPNTPDVEYTYTRTGQIKTVLDATGSRTLTYDQYGHLSKETFESGNMFYDRVITFDYEYQVGYTPPGGGEAQVFQFAGLADIQIGTNADPDADYQATYTYNADTARMTKVTGSGLPNGGANYTYDTYSPLIQKLEYIVSSSVKARSTRTYEPDRNYLQSIQNDELVTSPGTPTTVSKYAYRYDELGRRTDVVYTGTAFSGGSGDHLDLWGYNTRNELTASDRHAGTDPDSPGTAVAAQDRAFVYDAIGNRTQSTTGTDPTKYYCSNELNQYDTIDDDTSDCPLTVGADETLDYDLDGNLLTDGGSMGASTGREFTWDGENRLIRVAPTDPQDGDIKVEFVYDYMGRRVEKAVRSWDPNTSDWASTPISQLRWMYYEWQPLLEMNGASSNAPTKKYAWGLDLAGSGNNPTIDGVAGIGGLLAVRDVGQSKSFVCLYDGNGNVGQLVNLADGSTVAKYEYDAYGNSAASGTYATTNVMRFSTKQWDDETGLGYWGYRHYDPGSGRWISRDSIFELGGDNLYAFAYNLPINYIDPLGELSLAPGVSMPGPSCPQDGSPSSQPGSQPSGPTTNPSGRKGDPIDLGPIFDELAEQGDPGCGACFRINPRGDMKVTVSVDQINSGCKKSKQKLEEQLQSLVRLAKIQYWIFGYEQKCEDGCSCTDKKPIPRAHYTFSRTFTNVYLEYQLAPPGPKEDGCVGSFTLKFSLEMDGWYGTCVRSNGD